MSAPTVSLNHFTSATLSYWLFLKVTKRIFTPWVAFLMFLFLREGSRHMTMLFLSCFLYTIIFHTVTYSTSQSLKSTVSSIAPKLARKCHRNIWFYIFFSIYQISIRMWVPHPGTKGRHQCLKTCDGTVPQSKTFCLSIKC